MGSPAHSLHIAVAVPATPPSVGQPYLCRDMPQKAIPVSCPTSCDLAINSPDGSCKDFRATYFTFLCSPPPVWSCHLEKTNERGMGRRGTCLFAFPHQRESSIGGSRFIGFAVPEDLAEEAVFDETHTGLP